MGVVAWDELLEEIDHFVQAIELEKLEEQHLREILASGPPTRGEYWEVRRQETMRARQKHSQLLAEEEERAKKVKETMLSERYFLPTEWYVGIGKLRTAYSPLYRSRFL